MLAQRHPGFETAITPNKAYVVNIIPVNRDGIWLDHQRDVVIVFWICCILLIWHYFFRLWHATASRAAVVNCINFETQASNWQTHQVQNTTTASLCWSNNISFLPVNIEECQLTARNNKDIVKQKQWNALNTTSLSWLTTNL